MFVIAAICCVIGFLLPTEVLSSGMQSLLITFFGLLSAGLIPAITLLLTAPVPTSYSVAHLEQLEAKTEALLDGLISTLKVILIGGVATLIAGAGVSKISFLPGDLPLGHIIEQAPHRFLQAVVFSCFVIGLDRLRIFVAALRTARALRRDYALDEARRHLAQTAPTSDDVKAMFKRHPAFGATVTVLRKAPDEPEV